LDSSNCIIPFRRWPPEVLLLPSSLTSIDPVGPFISCRLILHPSGPLYFVIE
jgi:hypothetical protein